MTATASLLVAFLSSPVLRRAGVQVSPACGDRSAGHAAAGAVSDAGVAPSAVRYAAGDRRPPRYPAPARGGRQPLNQGGPPTSCCCASAVVCRLLVGGPSVDRQRPLPPGADGTGSRPVDAAASGPAPVLRLSSELSGVYSPASDGSLGIRPSCALLQRGDARRCRPNPPVPRLCPYP